MDEKNNRLHTSDDLPEGEREYLKSGDIQKAKIEQANRREAQAREGFASLREELADGRPIDSLKTLFTSSQNSSQNSPHPVVQQGSESFIPFENTRIAGSEGKNPVRGLTESVLAVPMAATILVGDFFALAAHPRKTWTNTRAALREEGKTYIV